MSHASVARYSAVASLIALVALAACGGDEESQADGSMASAEADTLHPSGLPSPYMVHRNWGVLPAGREWGRVSGVYVDPAGQTIWAFERCGGDSCVTSDDPTVLRFMPDGTLLTSFGADMFVRPHGMYVDDEGNVWVTDGRAAREAEIEEAPDAARKGNQVVKFSPEGEVLLVLGTPGAAGDPPEALNQPNDVIVAPNGEILVSEGHSYQGPHGRISRFAPDGTFLGTIGEFGDGAGQFIVPHGMAFDSQGRLFVATRGTNRIDIFGPAPAYEYIDSWHQFGRPNDVFIDDDDTMYVLDSESGDDRNPGFRRGIYVGSARTGELSAWVPPHEGRPPYGTIGEGIAVDAAGNIYVGEVSINGMTMFMPM
jgi:sugar lactone lactonase YvrE